MNLNVFLKYVGCLLLFLSTIIAVAEPAERGADGGVVEDRGAGGGATDDRGAGGGGDPLLAIIQAGKSRACLRSTNPIELPAENFKGLFCEKAQSGLKKLKSLSEEQSLTIENKLKEVCGDKTKIRIAEGLKLANGDVVSAMNWPKESIIALDAKRISAILQPFNQETSERILEALFFHEVASLVKLEHTGNYQYSMELIKESSSADPQPCGLQKQYELEEIIGAQALFFEMNRSAIDINQYHVGKKYSGAFLASDSNFLREQLLNFSPLFDEAIKPTLSANFLFQFRKRIASPGIFYFTPLNEHLLAPVLEQFKIAFAKQGTNVDFSSVKPTWALAIQLHQLYLAIDQMRKLHYYGERFEKFKFNFVVTTRRISLGLNFLPINGGKIQNNKNKIEITFNESLNSQLESLKNVFTFEVENKSDDVITYRQHWPELYIHNGKYRVYMPHSRFEYQMQKPSYHESIDYHPGEDRELFRKDFGLMAKDDILDFLKTELMDNR